MHALGGWLYGKLYLRGLWQAIMSFNYSGLIVPVKCKLKVALKMALKLAQ